MYGAVLDAEGSRIEVGEAAVICENAEWSDRISRYEHIAEVRVAEFGTHADDEVLNRG
ncbi:MULTISPECIES: hypothetical protein [unclassified Streptomyces]|uniref:hypothetical protein n=1 Tax=unclassified Streptomyces TaxID=2593676 RepID=UPI0033226176